MKRLLLLACIGSISWMLGSEPTGGRLFRRLPSSRTGIGFSNRIQESDTFNILRFEYLYNGGGVGIGDFNNDGRQDVYFSGNQVSGRLYLNRGGMQFEDVTEPAGLKTDVWCTGVTVVDLNQDGFQDLYVSVAGFGSDTSRRANRLFINETRTPGAPVRFREMAREYGLDDQGYSTQTAFFDYDHDGDLDAYVLTNALDRQNRNALRPKRLNGEAPSTDRLYRNDGPRDHPRFTDVSRQAGITIEGYGLGLAISDLNGDGWEDVYCANDFLSNDLVWINNRNGTFTNRAADYLRHQTHNGMGVDIADVNNDRLPDIMVVDMLPHTNERQKMMLPGYNYDRFRMDLQMGYQPQYMRNTLQLNRGAGPDEPVGGHRPARFSEIGQLAGVDKTDWSWAPLFADFDNDGFRDLLITNGYRRDVTNLDFTAYLADLGAGGFGDTQEKQLKAARRLRELPEVKLTNFCFRNRGDLTFEDVSARWGFDAPGYSNGAAYADLDNDGDLDILINRIDDEALVYENTLNETGTGKPEEKAACNHWLRVALDRKPAQGTKVLVYTGREVQSAELNPTRGYVSSVEPVLHFGLGKTALVDSVEIDWNTGQRQVLRRVPADQLLTVAFRPEGFSRPESSSALTAFQELDPVETGLAYTHVESEFNDFARTPLLPHKHSQNGPSLAVGDADGNGLEDLYVGADFGRPGVLFLQQPDGRFTRKEIPKNADQEDTGALFLDTDRDGDADLYVVSGGSHADGLSPAYRDRLYRNDGRGNFRPDETALPRIGISGSCVVAADFDRDGDLDLFRGSRLEPGRYPMPVSSLLLRNDGGHFTDVTAQLAPGLQKIGLVTSAVWTDTDRDGWPDLALTGEWMPLIILKNAKGQQFNHSAIQSFNHSPGPGWWNTLIACDFDHDGDADLMAGNRGLNTRYRPTPERPIEVYAADFDNNGRLDPILTHYNGARKFLTPARDLLMFQIPSMKRRFPDFASYAKAGFAESFTAEEIRSAYHTSATEFRSMYFENAGSGRFNARPLPMEAQFSTVQGILVRDFNQDGHPDALLTGNSYATETIGGWPDASCGTLLLGDGRGGFRPEPNSGLHADRDAKGSVLLHRKHGSALLVVANTGGPLETYRITPRYRPIQ
ncbi:VCBS repeat-containing protein [Larkinella soli]|uniref:VCBS repeat-containing protein n=1 Tax=Larkinella soli TaxID=1770527 RepID=UPI000FFBACF6|nr:VCBS repeat-containing protein [Larkinella soli]